MCVLNWIELMGIVLLVERVHTWLGVENIWVFRWSFTEVWSHWHPKWSCELEWTIVFQRVPLDNFMSYGVWIASFYARLVYTLNCHLFDLLIDFEHPEYGFPEFLMFYLPQPSSSRTFFLTIIISFLHVLLTPTAYYILSSLLYDDHFYFLLHKKQE
jgi:hypothetical protein